MKALTPLTKKQQKLVADYYEEALQIGRSFKSSVLYDDEKENIAVRALIRAAKNFDANRPVKVYKNKLKAKTGRTLFNTYLYRAVVNSLLSHKRINTGNGKYVTQKKHLGKDDILLESTIEARSAEQGKQENLSTLIAEPAENPTRMLEHQETMEQLLSYLTEREGFILTAMMQPDATFETVADQLGISRQRVHQQFTELRQTIKRLMREGVIKWTPTL